MLSLFYIFYEEIEFLHNKLKFSNPYSLQPGGVNFYYYKLRLFDLVELKIKICKVYDTVAKNRESKTRVCGKNSNRLHYSFHKIGFQHWVLYQYSCFDLKDPYIQAINNILYKMIFIKAKKFN